ncbi:MAG TPA: LamG domain-containing protein, partial [Candidatus Polarisedimenticolia bacterium]|nr:LamG domain-containing protein [Candidatus Polarisedimenticolia bacterium]
EFNSAEDRVRLPVPGEFHSLSYMAWLRVDSLPNAWNSLALVDTFKTGETHWQIHQDGSLELSVRMDTGKAGWDRLVSDPVITPEHFGKWIQLAAVYDGPARKMSLYFNGRLVASKTVHKTRPLSLGTVELGNWTPTAERSDANYRIRNFHGRMDEFALLSRPLSAEEIRRQYDLGKPRDASTAIASFKTTYP